MRSGFLDGLLAFTARHRWIWAALGVLLLWLFLSIRTSQFSLASLSGVAVTSSFLILVALGQTAVVTTGRGNIDLSIASVMTLSAYLALIVIGGQDGMVLPGLLAAVALGLVVGLVNAALVIFARIPSIIATLATGYVLATATLRANREIPGFATAPILREIATGRVGGVPIMVLIALAAVLIAGFLFSRTAWGQMLSAVGQNERAARLTGIRTGRIVASTFIASAVLASVTGVLLGAYVGGAFLEMGMPYRLQTIGAVVLGGTLIMGGGATAAGTLFGSVLLILIVTTMQIAGLPPGTQDMVQGVVIIAVLALAGGAVVRRRAAKPIVQAQQGNTI